VAAKTEARAAQSLKKEDPGLAGYALQCAKEDWSFAMENISNMNIELAGYALNASLNLYEATLNEKYKNAALSYGNYIMQCQQQKNLATNVSLKGFFYRDSTREEILHYEHRGHEQEPVVGLVRLCGFFPENADAEKWENAIRLYANYYKDITDYTDPYFMIPAGIYDLSKAEDEVEREQIKSGFRLNGRYYLKSFPTWESFRGNSGTILSQAKGLTKIGSYLEDRDLENLAYRQFEWHLGLNPFNQSLMYGEGYRYGNQYSAMSGNIVGGLPVGVQTHFNRDIPYWPSESCYNWKEIWVHPSSRWLWIMSDFYK
ncbi:MAG: glycoside hydrolase family 9 protein, partial [Bacteroidota bacterium]